MLFGQVFFNSDTKLVFVHANVILVAKLHTLILSKRFVVGFHFRFLTVVKAWLCVNSYKLFSSLSTSSTSKSQTCFEKVKPGPSYSHP